MILVCQRFLMLHRHHAPIGLIDLENHIVMLSFGTDIRNLLRRLGDIVQLNESSAYVNRLYDAHLRHKHMLQIERQHIICPLISIRYHIART